MWLWMAFAGLVVARFPYLPWGTAPWAEQAVVYISYAQNSSVADALLQQHLGYVAVAANVDGILHAALPWSWSPWLSVLTGLLGPALFVGVLLRAKAQTTTFLLAIATVVFTPLVIREWHTPIHFQFWIAATLVLIAGVDPTKRWHRAGDVAVGALAGLAGTVTLAAVPVLVAGTARPLDRRHRLVVAGLVTAGGLINYVLGTGRDAAVSIGRLPFLVVLKVFWQPVTGDAGRDLGADLYGWSGLAVAVLWVVVLGAIAFGLWTFTRGGWRVVALGGLWCAVVMIRFSLPPPELMLEPGLAGRYALAGGVPILVALIMSNERGRTRVVVVAVSIAVIVQGAHLAIGLRPLSSDRADAYRADVTSVDVDAGDTFRIEPAPCRYSPDPDVQSAGYSVEMLGVDDAGAMRLTPADVDAGRDIDVFVLSSSGPFQWDQHTADGRQRMDGSEFLGWEMPVRGWCFVPAVDPAPYATGVTGVTDLALDAAAFEEGERVFVVAGPSFPEALARGVVAEVRPGE